MSILKPRMVTTMYEAISYFMAGRVLISSLSLVMGESLLKQVDQISGHRTNNQPKSLTQL